MFKLRPYQQKTVDRTRQSFIDGYKAPVIVSPAGSGKSVILANIIKSATDKKNQVLFIVHRFELLMQIKDTLIRSGVNMNYVEMKMILTVVNKLDDVTKPKLIVVDESHHVLANSYIEVFEYFKDVPLIGFTASPIRLSGAGLGDVNDIMIEEVTVKELIENNYLAPYRYYAPKLIDTNELNIGSVNDFSNVSIDDSMDKNKIYGDAVKHYKKLANGEQAIVYAHSVESSIQAAEVFNDNGIVSAHIDGTTPKEKRDNIIQCFRDGEITVLSNIGIIGEGLDFPNCSTIIMLRPTESLSLFIQQSMRGMRYKEGKTSIIIDHVDNVSRHGLPDDDRVWSLDSVKKSESENEVMIKECENCYAVYTPEYLVCPMCGHKPVIKEAESYEIDEDAELEEVTESPLMLNFDNVLDGKTADDCKNMKELHELTKAKGFKPGYAYVQGKRLGFI